MTTEKFIKATLPVTVELNDKTYIVKPLSFKDYILIQRQMRKAIDDTLPIEDKEDAYVDLIKLLAESLKLPVDDVLDADTEFVNKLIDVFLVQTKTT
jgi:hypothetical protein